MNELFKAMIYEGISSILVLAISYIWFRKHDLNIGYITTVFITLTLFYLIFHKIVKN